MMYIMLYLDKLLGTGNGFGDRLPKLHASRGDVFRIASTLESSSSP